MTIGDKVKKLRDGMGLTQKEFADFVGLGDNTILSIEHNKNDTRIGTLQMIAKALNKELVIEFV